ncbi:glutamate receptor ionotropic, kainate 2-like [Babylonia areolata]
MWNYMSTQDDVFVTKSEDGVARVKKGGYAYLAESTAVEYAVARDCDLTNIGGNLDSKGYGIATPTDSVYREILTTEILRLTEIQKIHEWKTKWWKKELGAKTCDVEDSGKGSASELSVENVGGVFVVLMGGVVAGFFVAMCEFIWKARKNARKDQQTLCSEMAEEFRFAVRCFGSKKPVKKREEEITDNGLQFMPLTGTYGVQNSMGGKEVFA